MFNVFNVFYLGCLFIGGVFVCNNPAFSLCSTMSSEQQTDTPSPYVLPGKPKHTRLTHIIIFNKLAHWLHLFSVSPLLFSYRPPCPVASQGSDVKVYHLHSPFDPHDTRPTASSATPGTLTPDVTLPGNLVRNLSQRTLFTFLSSFSPHQCTPVEEVGQVVWILQRAKGRLWAMTRHWGLLLAWQPALPASSRSWPTSPTKQGRMPGWCAYSSSAAGECMCLATLTCLVAPGPLQTTLSYISKSHSVHQAHMQQIVTYSLTLTLCVCVCSCVCVCVLQASPVLLPDPILHEKLQGCVPHMPPLQQSPARREEKML